MNDYGNGINDLLEMLKEDDRFSEDSLRIVELLVDSAFTKGRIFELDKEMEKELNK